MRRRAKPPVVTDSDRLGLTFFLASVFHGLLILGVTFTLAPAAEDNTTPALDIILVQSFQPTKDDVEDPNFLAQISQQGGGDSDENVRPQDLFMAPSLAEDPGLALQSSPAKEAHEKQLDKTRFLNQKDSDYVIKTQDDQLNPDSKETPFKQTQEKQLKTARLAEEMSMIIEERSKKTKVKFMNSSTKEFAPAKYMREWINRVERIGNLNYPDMARRKKLSGTLILDVVINANGELVKTDLRKSSGHKILDDAAMRIVRLAAPFSAFPAELKKEADVIHITRSWEFQNNNKLRSN